MKFHGAMLFVRDLAVMDRFYRETLGLAPLVHSPGSGWIEFEGGFALHAIPQDVAAGIPMPSGAPRLDGACKPRFRVDDVDAARQLLLDAGVAILDRPWGGWDVVDPEGNIIAIEA